MDLTTLLERGGAWHNIPGASPTAFIREAFATFRLPVGLDHEAVLAATLEREASSSTALGGGTAFPHPGKPPCATTEDALVALVYPRFPVAWKAADGRPVLAAFFILSAERQEHLLALSRLAKLCRDDTFKAALRDEAPLRDILRLAAENAG